MGAVNDWLFVVVLVIAMFDAVVSSNPMRYQSVMIAQPRLEVFMQPEGATFAAALGEPPETVPLMSVPP